MRGILRRRGVRFLAVAVPKALNSEYGCTSTGAEGPRFLVARMVDDAGHPPGVGRLRFLAVAVPLRPVRRDVFCGRSHVPRAVMARLNAGVTGTCFRTVK